MKQPLQINCILCGKKVVRVLTPTIRGGIKREVLHCADCDLGILSGGLQEGEAEKFYKKEYRKKHSHNVQAGAGAKELFEVYEPFQHDRLRLLKPYFGKNKKLLELGCSAGMFLYHARRYVKEVVGVDYDASAAAYAAKVCKCVTYDTDLSKTPLAKESFDIVCAFQTLEHVVDPVQFLKMSGEYVKKDGILAIEVPNLHDALVSLYNLPNHHQFYFHETHVWYFSEKSLQRIMKKAGFEGALYFVQDYNVLNHLHWADIDAPGKGGVNGLGPPALPLRTTASAKTRKAVTDLLVKFDADYKQALAQHKVTSNLFFIGKKK